MNSFYNNQIPTIYNTYYSKPPTLGTNSNPSSSTSPNSSVNWTGEAPTQTTSSGHSMYLCYFDSYNVGRSVIG